MYTLMMGGDYGGAGPQLMFFEQSKKEGYNEEAGEIINLRGWKREDIKDILLTLLPNAWALIRLRSQTKRLTTTLLLFY